LSDDPQFVAFLNQANSVHTLPYSFFNLLKTKSRLLYLKAQFVPRCKHFSSRL